MIAPRATTFGAGVPDLLAQRAALSRHKLAIRDVGTGARYTYQDLNSQADGAAWALRAAGIAPGDRVAVLSRNCAELFILLFACARTGAILVQLNWRSAGPELAAVLADASPTLILAAQDFAPRLAEIGYPSQPLEALAGVAGEAAPLERPSWVLDRPLYLLYTSGTTGAPKGVIQTVRMAMVNAQNVHCATGLSGADRGICHLPTFHTAGINLYTLPLLLAGGQVTIIPQFIAEDVFDLIAAGDVTLMFGVPTIYRDLLPLLQANPRAAGRVRHWAAGGAALPRADLDAYRRLGVTLCHGYGMTETGPAAFFMDPDDVAAHPAAVGRIQMMSEARIVDDTGRPLPPGEVGEVQFRGPGITPGYWNNAAATGAAFSAAGWLSSGDLAWMDATGLTHFVGRKKEMFVSGGENVYLAEVERALSDHPGVADLAVIAVPDERWGEVGLAFVEAKPGARLTAAALDTFGRQVLAAYKVPKGFVFVRSLPRTATGKIKKTALQHWRESEEGEDVSHDIAVHS